MSASAFLERFYAVTGWQNETTSVYEAKIGGEGEKPILTKIALKGGSKIAVGDQIKNGTMLWIGEFLLLFIPEGGGGYNPRIERDAVLVNTRYWGGGTSSIIALFLHQKKPWLVLSQKI